MGSRRARLPRVNQTRGGGEEVPGLERDPEVCPAPAAESGCCAADGLRAHAEVEAGAGSHPLHALEDHSAEAPCHTQARQAVSTTRASGHKRVCMNAPPPVSHAPPPRPLHIATRGPPMSCDGFGGEPSEGVNAISPPFSRSPCLLAQGTYPQSREPHHDERANCRQQHQSRGFRSMHAVSRFMGHCAAVKIQRVWRGHRVRRVLAHSIACGDDSLLMHFREARAFTPGATSVASRASTLFPEDDDGDEGESTDIDDSGAGGAVEGRRSVVGRLLSSISSVFSRRSDCSKKEEEEEGSDESSWGGVQDELSSEPHESDAEEGERKAEEEEGEDLELLHDHHSLAHADMHQIMLRLASSPPAQLAGPTDVAVTDASVLAARMSSQHTWSFRHAAREAVPIISPPLGASELNDRVHDAVSGVQSQAPSDDSVNTQFNLSMNSSHELKAEDRGESPSTAASSTSSDSSMAEAGGDEWRNERVRGESHELQRPSPLPSPVRHAAKKKDVDEMEALRQLQSSDEDGSTAADEEQAGGGDESESDNSDGAHHSLPEATAVDAEVGTGHYAQCAAGSVAETGGMDAANHAVHVNRSGLGWGWRRAAVALTGRVWRGADAAAQRTTQPVTAQPTANPPSRIEATAMAPPAVSAEGPLASSATNSARAVGVDAVRGMCDGDSSDSESEAEPQVQGGTGLRQGLYSLVDGGMRLVFGGSGKQDAGVLDSEHRHGHGHHDGGGEEEEDDESFASPLESPRASSNSSPAETLSLEASHAQSSEGFRSPEASSSVDSPPLPAVMDMHDGAVSPRETAQGSKTVETACGVRGRDAGLLHVAPRRDCVTNRALFGSSVVAGGEHASPTSAGAALRPRLRPSMRRSPASSASEHVVSGSPPAFLAPAAPPQASNVYQRQVASHCTPEAARQAAALGGGGIRTSAAMTAAGEVKEQSPPPDMPLLARYDTPLSVGDFSETDSFISTSTTATPSPTKAKTRPRRRLSPSCAVPDATDDTQELDIFDAWAAADAKAAGPAVGLGTQQPALNEEKEDAASHHADAKPSVYEPEVDSKSDARDHERAVAQAVGRGLVQLRRLWDRHLLRRFMRVMYRAVLEASAATTFQRFARGYLARQAVSRLLLAQAETAVALRNLEHRRAAAERLQATVRRRRAERLLMQARSAAIRLQSYTRMLLTRLRFLRLKVLTIGLQSLARGFLARRCVRRGMAAVSTIQRHTRGWLARRYCRYARNLLNFQRAVVVLQSRLRGRNARRVHVKFMSTVRQLQRRLKCSHATRHRRRKHAQAAAAVKIQSMVRGAVCRRRLVSFRLAVVVLQASFRRRRPMSALKLSRAAAVRIQSRVRGSMARSTYSQLRSQSTAFTTINLVESWPEEMTVEERRQLEQDTDDEVNRVLEAWTRVYMSRSRNSDAALAVTHVQRAFRARRVSRAVTIQRLWRRALFRLRLQRIREAAELEEVRWDAAVDIQRVYRGSRVRAVLRQLRVERAHALESQRREAAAATIQRVARGHKARLIANYKRTLIAIATQYLEEQHAIKHGRAMKLMRAHVRRWRARRKQRFDEVLEIINRYEQRQVARQTNAATTIQRAFRCHRVGAARASEGSDGPLVVDVEGLHETSTMETLNLSVNTLDNGVDDEAADADAERAADATVLKKAASKRSVFTEIMGQAAQALKPPFRRSSDVDDSTSSANLDDSVATQVRDPLRRQSSGKIFSMFRSRRASSAASRASSVSDIDDSMGMRGRDLSLSSVRATKRADSIEVDESEGGGRVLERLRRDDVRSEVLDDSHNNEALHNAPAPAPRSNDKSLEIVRTDAIVTVVKHKGRAGIAVGGEGAAVEKAVLQQAVQTPKKAGDAIDVDQDQGGVMVQSAHVPRDSQSVQPSCGELVKYTGITPLDTIGEGASAHGLGAHDNASIDGSAHSSCVPIGLFQLFTTPPRTGRSQSLIQAPAPLSTEAPSAPHTAQVGGPRSRDESFASAFSNFSNASGVTLGSVTVPKPSGKKNGSAYSSPAKAFVRKLSSAMDNMVAFFDDTPSAPSAPSSDNWSFLPPAPNSGSRHPYAQRWQQQQQQQHAQFNRTQNNRQARQADPYAVYNNEALREELRRSEREAARLQRADREFAAVMGSSARDLLRDVEDVAADYREVSRVRPVQTAPMPSPGVSSTRSHFSNLSVGSSSAATSSRPTSSTRSRSRSATHVHTPRSNTPSTRSDTPPHGGEGGASHEAVKTQSQPHRSSGPRPKHKPLMSGTGAIGVPPSATGTNTGTLTTAATTAAAASRLTLSASLRGGDVAATKKPSDRPADSRGAGGSLSSGRSFKPQQQAPEGRRADSRRSTTSHSARIDGEVGRSVPSSRDTTDAHDSRADPQIARQVEQVLTKMKQRDSDSATMSAAMSMLRYHSREEGALTLLASHESLNVIWQVMYRFQSNTDIMEDGARVLLRISEVPGQRAAVVRSMPDFGMRLLGSLLQSSTGNSSISKKAIEAFIREAKRASINRGNY